MKAQLFCILLLLALSSRANIQSLGSLIKEGDTVRSKETEKKEVLDDVNVYIYKNAQCSGNPYSSLDLAEDECYPTSNGGSIRVSCSSGQYIYREWVYSRTCSTGSVPEFYAQAASNQCSAFTYQGTTVSVRAVCENAGLRLLISWVTLAAMLFVFYICV
eukprot:TRINITY_DN15858_c0_g1_i1.p1 TRINITY_DN15858_c0_g1~~TRINITY_DN15858_c0_g1_i1.p1  ORF type:complete len:160 (-),score=14.12 TRINITY_DN15858_c0_g1_i1:73-552(-)